jgi:hypothetical protein
MRSTPPTTTPPTYPPRRAGAPRLLRNPALGARRGWRFEWCDELSSPDAVAFRLICRPARRLRLHFDPCSRDQGRCWGLRICRGRSDSRRVGLGFVSTVAPSGGPSPRAEEEGPFLLEDRAEPPERKKKRSTQSEFGVSTGNPAPSFGEENHGKRREGL